MTFSEGGHPALGLAVSVFIKTSVPAVQRNRLMVGVPDADARNQGAGATKEKA